MPYGTTFRLAFCPLAVFGFFWESKVPDGVEATERDEGQDEDDEVVVLLHRSLLCRVYTRIFEIVLVLGQVPYK